MLARISGCDWTTEVVPEGKLFVLVDNRGASADSRAHLCRESVENCTKSPWVDTDLVVGKVFSLVWPRDRGDWISNPGVFDAVQDFAEMLEPHGSAVAISHDQRFESFCIFQLTFGNQSKGPVGRV